MSLVPTPAPPDGTEPVARTVGLTDEQRAMRRLGIGASDIPAICGLSANRGPLGVYRSKVEGWDEPSTEQMEFGHRFEDMAVKWFEDLTGLGVVDRQRSVEHRVHPWRRATIDGEVVPETPPRQEWAIWTVPESLGVLEIKSFNVVEDGDVKADVLAQVLWQLHVRQLPQAWVFGLVGHAPQIRQVHLADNADNLAWIIEQAERFWFDHVVAGVPPAPTRADLPMLEGTPAAEDTTIEVADEVAGWWAERCEIAARVKADEARKDELDALIRNAIGSATTATVAGIPILTASTTTRRAPDMEAVRQLWPADLGPLPSKTTTYRTLRQPSKSTRRTR